MTDVVNPKSASPDQLLPYHKKISAEGIALMKCFISYTYMVLKETLDKEGKGRHVHAHFAINVVNHKNWKKRHENTGDVKRRRQVFHQIAMGGERNEA